MPYEEVLGKDILTWRRINLSKGGRQVDIDWLLDIGGGLRWSDIQKIFLYPEKEFVLEVSLLELEKLWLVHINTGQPLQHLIGKCPWRDFELEVNSDALIPRQETELLIDFALLKFKQSSKGIWVDLGTGSGAIAIALARNFPHWEGHIVDCSPEALSLAEKNFSNLCPDSRVSFYLGSWWEPLREFNNYFDLVLSNPPYIPVDVLSELDSTVRDYEPSLALCGGQDGLVACRELVSGASKGLSDGGWLIFEHHYDQSEKALKLLDDHGFKNVSYKNDLEGIRRFAMGQRASK